ncbi:hypothetical protein Pla52n_66630 [Stieleria varia]|uniref:Uncharacterized protein n=1 Tax=Stieleria varia TaxID=2528005 RepID=A0A5C5ZW91_9BACT|nr:hypothetical protein Pla52n_66630 [Stieleria varia]
MYAPSSTATAKALSYGDGEPCHPAMMPRFCCRKPGCKRLGVAAFTVYARWILCFRRACPGSEQQMAATLNTIAFTSPPPANRRRRFAGGGEVFLACVGSRQLFPPPRQARRKEFQIRKRLRRGQTWDSGFNRSSLLRERLRRGQTRDSGFNLTRLLKSRTLCRTRGH